jgi:hypothetical protein
MTRPVAGIVEVRQSPLAMLGMIAISIVLTAVSVAVLVMLHDDRTTTSKYFLEFAAHAGIALSSVGTVLILWRLFTVRGPVVTVTAEGIRDIRVAAEFIPWRAITDISTWRSRGKKVIILAVDPVVENRLTLTRMARWSRGPNRLLGIDGLCIVAVGLDTSLDELLRLCMAGMQNRGNDGRLSAGAACSPQ